MNPGFVLPVRRSQIEEERIHSVLPEFKIPFPSQSLPVRLQSLECASALARGAPRLVSLWVGQICGIQLPDRNRVGVVVYRRETNHIVTDLHDIQSKCTTLRRIDRELADEFTLHSEFHDFAGLIGIRIDPVATC